MDKMQFFISRLKLDFRCLKPDCLKKKKDLIEGRTMAFVGNLEKPGNDNDVGSAYRSRENNPGQNWYRFKEEAENKTNIWSREHDGVAELDREVEKPRGIAMASSQPILFKQLK